MDKDQSARGDEDVITEDVVVVSRRHDRDALPEAYLRWLGAQIPAMAASSQKNKQQPCRVGVGGVDGGKDKKHLTMKTTSWFTLQWTMDNVPIIPDGLW